MIKVKKMIQTCLACPVQFEGIDVDGNYIYIRERNGSFRVDYKEPGNTILGPLEMKEFPELAVIKEATSHILDWSEADVEEMNDDNYDSDGLFNFLESLKRDTDEEC